MLPAEQGGQRSDRALAYLVGWRGAFIAFGVLGLVWVALFSRWYRDVPAEHPAVNEAELLLLSEAGRPGEKPPPLSWATTAVRLSATTISPLLAVAILTRNHFHEVSRAAGPK